MRPLVLGSWIALGITIVALAFFGIVPVAVLGGSWWWFFGPLIFLGGSWIIFGSIILALKIFRPKPTIQKIDLTNTKSKAIYDMKNDTENPDNFQILNYSLKKVGEKGKEPTPVLILDGQGTETLTRRIAIYNLKNIEENTLLIDPSDEEIERAIREIAEPPPELEIKEEIPIGSGPFGPITKIITKKPTSSEIKQQIEKQEAE